MATRNAFARGVGPAAFGLVLAAATAKLTGRRRRADAARLQERLLEVEELAARRRALAHQQRMHWELLARAIDDPSLASVIDTYDKSIPAEKRRQFLYANAWYAYLYHVYRAGLLDREELYTYLREFFQSPLFREYWEASRAQRATLKQTSDEARIGRMVDALVKELDEADTDEWWVVGTPPSD
ncbi:DUF6082 family protein [Streptomyces fumanus]|uniref:Secreted protein n=1 Tax=Streptomyces fumanus TaxID=67302 RepID=A0A919AHG0_9ACTN|nr:DUF6082 family protein [Streptomyces fumanus]GHF09532.1 hypothetical protein GCM10018772_38010 [Streptomyces fumanus]